MNARRSITLTAALAMLTFAPAAMAHPGHAGHGGFAAGVGHPLSGLDHVLAIIAVGLLAVQRGGRTLWMLPLTFVGLMVIGGMLALLGMPMPGVEQGIAASVLVLGLALAIKFQPPAWATLGMVGLFAIFHGHAHMIEMHAGESPAAYAAGFVFASVALHAIGVALGISVRRLADIAFIRAAGAGIAVCGVLLLAGLM
jgi:urease accessory protein